ncbi:MAG: hypothetical protein ACD_80C00142G0010 [uncultured bacterium (gcode 4)]|uniref:Uncharacterized protein n=1 Tax=uncultured bacterium (gcode 4) TaxID=1234023 RepID=K1XX45_9BACT|nr:MAG: hypothetical protein ACD_80C00142G0010 [uncultured bacterium (gcode 4)]
MNMKNMNRIKWFFLSSAISIFVIVILAIRLLWERTIKINDDNDSVSANIENFKEIEMIFVWRNDESQGDDSLSPEFKDIIELKKGIDGKWQIIDQKNLWKCQPDRWHQDFSTELCI